MWGDFTWSDVDPHAYDDNTVDGVGVDDEYDTEFE